MHNCCSCVFFLHTLIVLSARVVICFVLLCSCVAPWSWSQVVSFHCVPTWLDLLTLGISTYYTLHILHISTTHPGHICILHCTYFPHIHCINVVFKYNVPRAHLHFTLCLYCCFVLCHPNIWCIVLCVLSYCCCPVKFWIRAVHLHVLYLFYQWHVMWQKWFLNLIYLVDVYPDSSTKPTLHLKSPHTLTKCTDEIMKYHRCSHEAAWECSSCSKAWPTYMTLPATLPLAWSWDWAIHCQQA